MLLLKILKDYVYYLIFTLDKVKESTAALNDMSTNEVVERPSQRKSSRFLKRNSFDHSAESRSYNTSVGRMDDGVGRMADEILGENIYPPREDSRTSAMRSSLPTRKHSYQSSSDADRFSDRSSPESRPTRYDFKKRKEKMVVCILRKNFIDEYDIFHEKISTAFQIGHIC